jgi:hypothetical protein
MSDQQNPIDNIAKLVNEILKNFGDFFKSRDWFNLFIYLSVLLFLLFAPEKGFLYPLDEENKKPLAINWRTATAYESTKAILEGLKIAKKKREYCGGFLNVKSFLKVHNCMRNELKNVLVSNDFTDLHVAGAKAGTSISFEDGERFFSEDLGVVVEARSKNFHVIDTFK